MNVLVVDDELGLRQTLILILKAEGHDVRAAMRRRRTRCASSPP